MKTLIEYYGVKYTTDFKDSKKFKEFISEFEQENNEKVNSYFFHVRNMFLITDTGVYGFSFDESCCFRIQSSSINYNLN